MKSKLQNLYYDRKVSLYMLTKERKRQEEQDVERLLQKTKKNASAISLEEEELQRLISHYNINLKGKKLPYSRRIQQICANETAFHRYKRDQREMLEYSKMKSKEYIERQKNEFFDVKVIMKAGCFGEESLDPREKERYEEMMDREVVISIYNNNILDELILKQQEVRKQMKL